MQNRKKNIIPEPHKNIHEDYLLEKRRKFFLMFTIINGIQEETIP